MIEALISAVLIISLIQKSEHARFAGLVLGLTACAHYALVEKFGLTGFEYCFTAGTSGAIVVFLIAYLAKVTRVSDTILAIGCVSIILNFDGFLLYSYGFSTEPYNLSIAALYLIAITSLLRGDCANDYARTYQRHPGFRVFVTKCSDFCFSLSRKA